jgi:hypothetical protein
MRILRTICLLLLALLYLGGTLTQVYGAAFPLVGAGQKTVGDFKGRTKAPVVPTILLRRHMPMVKPVVVSPLLAVDQPEFGRPEGFCFSPAPDNGLSLLSIPNSACGTRAPPALSFVAVLLHSSDCALATIPDGCFTMSMPVLESWR